MSERRRIKTKVNTRVAHLVILNKNRVVIVVEVSIEVTTTQATEVSATLVVTS